MPTFHREHSNGFFGFLYLIFGRRQMSWFHQKSPIDIIWAELTHSEKSRYRREGGATLQPTRATSLACNPLHSPHSARSVHGLLDHQCSGRRRGARCRRRCSPASCPSADGHNIGTTRRGHNIGTTRHMDHMDMSRSSTASDTVPCTPAALTNWPHTFTSALFRAPVPRLCGILVLRRLAWLQVGVASSGRTMSHGRAAFTCGSWCLRSGVCEGPRHDSPRTDASERRGGSLYASFRLWALPCWPCLGVERQPPLVRWI